MSDESIEFVVTIPDDQMTHDVDPELEDKLDIEGRQTPSDEINEILDEFAL